MKHAERRSRSKEDRIEGEGKRRRKLKAECVIPASNSDTDLKKECLSFLFGGSFGSDASRCAVIIINSMTSSAKRKSVMQCVFIFDESNPQPCLPPRPSLYFELVAFHINHDHPRLSVVRLLPELDIRLADRLFFE